MGSRVLYSKAQFSTCLLQWTWSAAPWFRRSCCTQASGKLARVPFLCHSFCGSSKSCFGEPGWEQRNRCTPELQNSPPASWWPCLTGEKDVPCGDCLRASQCHWYKWRPGAKRRDKTLYYTNHFPSRGVCTPFARTILQLQLFKITLCFDSLVVCFFVTHYQLRL